MVYHVIYSPTYKVHVSYFFLPDPFTAPEGVSRIDVVYETLVPKYQHDTLRTIGVMGGIGMTVSLHSVNDLIKHS